MKTKPASHFLIRPEPRHTPNHEARATVFYCLRMVGSAVMFLATCALIVCTTFADIIAASPEAWLATFSLQGMAGWGLFIGGGAITAWAHRHFQKADSHIARRGLWLTRITRC